MADNFEVEEITKDEDYFSFDDEEEEELVKVFLNGREIRLRFGRVMSD